MLRPAMNDSLEEGQSYCSFVIAVAKRAREIAEDAIENGTMLNEKPVDLAVNDFADEKFTFIETEASRG